MKNNQSSNFPNGSFYIIDLHQGTTEWLEWRRSGIGASDAHVAMSRGFRTRQNLIKDKKGILTRDYQSKAMEEGHQLEPEARTLYIKTTGKKIRPACIQSSRYDWLIASLDGISDDHATAVEIKCGATTYKTVEESRVIPRYYYPQVQHILAVTGLSSIDFWCYRPNEKSILLPIERDDSYIKKLLKAELILWNEVKSATDIKVKENPVKQVTKKPKDEPIRQLDRSRAQAYLSTGIDYHDSQSYEQAIEAYTKAIYLDPDYARAYLSRGLSYDGSEEYEKAIEDYTKAIHLKPNYAKAYLNRGAAYDMSGQYEKALEDYTEAIRLDPSKQELLEERGFTLKQMLLDQLDQIDANDAQTYLHRGISPTVT